MIGIKRLAQPPQCVDRHGVARSERSSRRQRRDLPARSRRRRGAGLCAQPVGAQPPARAYRRDRRHDANRPRESRPGRYSFFMSVFDGVQTVLSRHHLDLVALLCASGEDTDDYLRRMVSRGLADGFIISVDAAGRPTHRFLAERQVPFATLGRSTTDAGQPWLDIDFETIARDRRPAARRSWPPPHRRHRAARRNQPWLHLPRCRRRRARLARPSRSTRRWLFRSTPSEAGGYGIARGLLALAERPTAILLVNETITTGFYRGLFEADYLPGRDIAVDWPLQPADPLFVADADQLPLVSAGSGGVAGRGVARQHARLCRGLIPAAASVRCGRSNSSPGKATSHARRTRWSLTLPVSTTTGPAREGRQALRPSIVPDTRS